MNGSHVPNCTALGAHDYGFSNSAGVCVEHATKQFSTGDARRGEEHIVAANQVVYGEYHFGVYAGGFDVATLTFVAEIELALHIAAQRLERRCSYHSFGSATRAHQHVYA